MILSFCWLGSNVSLLQIGVHFCKIFCKVFLQAGSIQYTETKLLFRCIILYFFVQKISNTSSDSIFMKSVCVKYGGDKGGKGGKGVKKRSLFEHTIYRSWCRSGHLCSQLQKTNQPTNQLKPSRITTSAKTLRSVICMALIHHLCTLKSL